VFVCDKCLSSDKADKITAVPISSSASAAATGYGCKNSVLCVKGFMCSSNGCVLNGTPCNETYYLTLFSSSSVKVTASRPILIVAILLLLSGLIFFISDHFSRGLSPNFYTHLFSPIWDAKLISFGFPNNRVQGEVHTSRFCIMY
jgi:hypothetical protein